MPIRHFGSLFFCRSIAVLVGTAARLDWDTRLFPWAIGIPALALAVRRLLADWRSAGTNAEPGEATRYVGVLDIPVDRSIPPDEMFRHTVWTAYWILTFACGIWFLIPEANAGKFSAAIVGGLTFLFVWALFDQLMHLAWPEVALFTLLRFKVLQ